MRFYTTKSLLKQNNNETLVSEHIFMLLNMVLNQNILSMLIKFINQTKE